MSKLFIFAIGGTGARVMKAFTMLLASGIKLDNVSEIVPIIVDPHKANIDLKRTEEILNYYKKIRDIFKPNETGDFFHTEIKKLKDVINGDGIEDTYTFQLKGVSNETFRDYIDFNTLGSSNDDGESYSPNKDLVSLLFSEKQLDTNMDIGFVGNPSIGSVVLNQFQDSNAFKQFASNFAQNDRVFIISSIFGGTGAAGFPIILKNIRGAAEIEGIENPEHLRNAKVGAISVQPYFGLEPNDEKRVDKATFYSKTKAALQYYQRGVNRSVDRLYYIGDKVTSNFKYDPGEGGQKNDAHFIELAAATSIIDFANTPDNGFDKPIGRRFMIKNNSDELSFGDLTDRTRFTIGTALAKFTIFCLYLEHSIDNKVSSTSPWIKDAPMIDRSFLQGTFYHSYIKAFNQSYIDWINEMAKNKRAFRAFNLGKDLTHLLVGQEPKKSLMGFGAAKATFEDVDEVLNAYTRGKSFISQEVKLIKIFSKGLDKFMNTKFPNF